MYAAMRATSLTIARFLERRFTADSVIGPLFAGPGDRVVSFNTPHEMTGQNREGPIGLALPDRARRGPAQPDAAAPRAHPGVPPPVAPPPPLYDLRDRRGRTPRRGSNRAWPDRQGPSALFHDQPVLRGPHLEDDFVGTAVELTSRLESLTLEETTRIYEALASSFQVCFPTRSAW
jgi:hypothetical protein